MSDGFWIADNPASEKYPCYTRANAGEVMPDPVSPLSATTGLAGAGEQGWRDAYVKIGAFDHDEFEGDRRNTIGVFGGYLYLNMSLTRIYGVRMPGLTPEIVDFQYFGDMPGITPYHAEARPTDESPRHGELLQGYLAELFAKDDFPELRADRDQTIRLVKARPNYEDLTDQELIDHARSFIPLYRRLFCRHILISAASGIGIGTVAQALAAIDRPEAVMTLVSGLGDVDSAAPSFALWEISREVRASKSLTALFDDGVAGLPARLEAAAELGDVDAQEFQWRLKDFLDNFGSRGPNEWEFRSHVWGTRRELPLAAIDRMRFACDVDSPSARADIRTVEREAMTAEIEALLDGNDEALGTFRAGLRTAHLTNVGRERTKTNNIRIVHEMRLAFREVGRRMVERGIFDNVEQVFMLADAELDDFVEKPEAFTATVRERETHYLGLWDLEPPFVAFGAPAPTSQWRKRAVAGRDAVAVGAVLTGIPGCSGTVVGRARVILDPADPRGLEPGEILIAPYTDPAWTPLFVPAGGVIVDVGAQITHAVIVSRELGLPCVVSVTDATRKIPDGAIVEVDGQAGTVTVLELPS